MPEVNISLLIKFSEGADGAVEQDDRKSCRDSGRTTFGTIWAGMRATFMRFNCPLLVTWFSLSIGVSF